MRRGRQQGLSDQPGDSDKSYRLAIDQACQAGLNGEAAAALSCIWTIGIRYGLPDEGWMGATGLARDMRLLGGDYLPTGYDRRAAGVAELAEDKLPAALRELRAFLWRSVVAGRLADEVDAHRLLGQLYATAGELGLATHHLIRAGDAKAVQEVLATAASTFIDCTRELDRKAPWEQATALTALAAEGDLIPDSQVEGITSRAFDLSKEDPHRIFGPSEWHAAYKLLAALAPRMPLQLVEPLLDALDSQIHREPNHYRFNDDEHVQIVVRLLSYRHEPKERLASHLLSLVAENDQLGQQVLKFGGAEVVAAEPALFVSRLRELAERGSRTGVDLLLHIGDSHEIIITEAKELLQRVLDQPTRPVGEHPIGTQLPRVASFVRTLSGDERERFADVAMRQAESAQEMEVNRTDALRAVFIVARTLSADSRNTLFSQTIALGSAPTFSEIDEQLKAGLHPLNPFHINVGFGSLIPQAVITAAELASTSDEYRQVVAAAAPLLRSGDIAYADQACYALSRLPRDVLNVDVQLFAGSANPSMRQLAVLLWSEQPGTAVGLGHQLARDPSRSVRRVLAGALATLRLVDAALANEVRAILVDDPCASIRVVAKG
jgi:hypothetical protein